MRTAPHDDLLRPMNTDLPDESIATQTKEHIWDANGSITDTMIDTSVVDDLVSFDLAKRTANGLAQFRDFVGHHNYAEELAYLRDGVPRSY